MWGQQQSPYLQLCKKQGGNLAVLLLMLPDPKVILAQRIYWLFRQAVLNPFCPAELHCMDRVKQTEDHACSNIAGLCHG